MIAYNKMMKSLILLLFMSLSVNAQQVTITFNASKTLNVTYSVYQNANEIISGTTLLAHKANAKTGDVFYARSVLNGLESPISNIAIVGDCSKPAFSVAKNRSYKTRPMRDMGLNKTKQRIAVGTKCEDEMVKRYSSRDWHFATNKKGFRGLVICGVSR